MKQQPKKSKSKKKKKYNRFRLLFSLSLGAVFLAALRLGFFIPLENRWQDQMHLFRGMRQADPRVVLVTIDDRSIREIGQYPWPRRVYAPLIVNLNRFGARCIGFDVIFVNPSNPEDDRRLIEATRKAGNVIHAVSVDLDQINTDLGHYVFEYAIEPLRRAAVSSGFIYSGFIIDSDGAVRRFPLMVGSRRLESHQDAQAILSDTRRVPSLGMALLAAYEGKAPEQYVRDLGPMITLNVAGERSWSEPHPSGAKVKGKPLMVEKHEYGFRRIPAIDVIRGTLSEEDRASLKGAIVLIGSTAQAAYDHFPNPFAELSPGVEVHANFIDNLLQANHLRSLPEWVDYLAPMLAILLALGLIRLGPLAGSLLVLAGVLVWGGVDYRLFLNNRRVGFVAPVLALASAYFILLVERALHEQREKRWIKGTFSQYLSPKVVDILTAHPEKLRLGGEKRDMSIFFIDVAHFTSISEKMDPEMLTHFLNKYLTALTNVILKHDGVVDKYIGDCIMAFWNAPLDQAKHRELACLSALECVKVVDKLNHDLVGTEIPEKLGIRVGLNSGHAVVGNMGSDMRFSYTVIGDAVNVAARLEGANKFFGSSILASEDIIAPCLDKLEARELGKIRVVGKNVPLKVYDIWDHKGQLSAEKKEALDVFASALALFYGRDFDKSAGRFEDYLKLFPHDHAAKMYLHECHHHAKHPPNEHWEGVFNLASK